MEKSGQASSSTMYTDTSSIVAQLSGAATKVIPLLTPNHNPECDAWIVAVANAVRTASIPRTYISCPKVGQPKDTISKLRDTFEQKNARCSVVSVTSSRVLICVWYSKLTTGLQEARQG